VLLGVQDCRIIISIEGVPRDSNYGLEELLSRITYAAVLSAMIGNSDFAFAIADPCVDVPLSIGRKYTPSRF
jgi:hypothetical protein